MTHNFFSFIQLQHATLSFSFRLYKKFSPLIEASLLHTQEDVAINLSKHESNRICHLLALLRAHHILYFNMVRVKGHFYPLNVELNHIWHLLALLGAHHILHISRVRVKGYFKGLSTL